MIRFPHPWLTCLSALLAAVVAVPLLAGCSGSTTSKDSTKTDNAAPDGGQTKKDADPGPHNPEQR